MTDEVSPTRKIGLALSGGGARGLAHIGVFKVLEQYLCRSISSLEPAWAQSSGLVSPKE